MAQYLHVPQRIAFPSQAIRSSIDHNNRFLAQSNPYDIVHAGIISLDTADDFIDGIGSWLSASIDIGTRYIPEATGSPNTVWSVLGLLKPLVRLEESAAKDQTEA